VTDPDQYEYVDFYRASKSCLCSLCGKEYQDHPFSNHRDWLGEKYLHRLCNGDHVKL